MLCQSKVIKAEYLRRGRPLKKTHWQPQDICRFMRVFLRDKHKDEDLGSHAKMFTDPPAGGDGKSPMPEFVLEAEAHDLPRVPCLTQPIHHCPSL